MEMFIELVEVDELLLAVAYDEAAEKWVVLLALFIAMRSRRRSAIFGRYTCVSPPILHGVRQLHGDGQCSRKRVQQLKKNVKSHVFLKSEKT